MVGKGNFRGKGERRQLEKRKPPGAGLGLAVLLAIGFWLGFFLLIW